MNKLEKHPGNADLLQGSPLPTYGIVRALKKTSLITDGESGPPPQFNQLFLLSLLSCPEHFIKIC